MEYAFKASMDNDDIVQPVQSYSSSSLSSEQVENGKTIYFTAVNGDLVTADKTPLPFLKKDDNLYKLVGLFKDGDGEVEPVYALTDSINYKERGFTINEGTNKSTINDGEDYTDLSVPFTNKFKDNRQFIKIDNVFDIEDTYSAPVEEDEDSVSNEEQTTDSTSEENSSSSNEFTWADKADNSFEVSTKGDERFSALNATFKPGTVIDGVNVGGRTIEDVYQKVIKKSGKGQAPAKDSKLYNESLKTKEDREDFSYTEGYLPLWQEWARQNPELIEELREKAKGKVLTDMFANTRVSQARALADILNSTANTSNNDNTINELTELGEKRQIECKQL